MSITYGFFNSVDHDRVYNADQIGDMFKGLISNGVYESVGDAFKVNATTGLTVSIGTGRAIVGAKWIENDAVTTLTLSTAHATLPRIDAIVLRRSTTTRDVSLIAVEGTPASSPSAPYPVIDATTYDITLAQIRVAAGATTITQANIYDLRGSSMCPWVTGIIQQVDTSELFDQYAAAYGEMMQTMQNWMVNQQTAFDNWFSTLTQDLVVGMYIDEYRKRAVLTGTGSQSISLNMTGYTYEEGDIIHVYINGLLASETEYTLNTTSNPATITVDLTKNGNINNIVEIIVTKSRVGDPSGGSQINQVTLNTRNVGTSTSTETANGEVTQ